MKLAEARPEQSVIYQTDGGGPEYGVIVAVIGPFVFVRYGQQAYAKATAPEMLRLVGGVS